MLFIRALENNRLVDNNGNNNKLVDSWYIKE